MSSPEGTGRTEWLGLPRTIPAQLTGIPVTLIDLSPNAVLIEHLRDFGPDPLPLEFMWQGEVVRLTCKHRRILEEFWDGDVKGNVYESEMEILSADAHFSRLIEAFHRQIERAQEANLSGDVEANRLEGGATIADIGLARRERIGGFITWHLTPVGWRRESSSSTRQPENGFTVAAHEAEEQVRLLQLAYEEANEEGRRMMREFAALALQPWD